MGKHCSEPTCKRLDFLPMKCDACSQIFCGDHITYSTHSCTESYKKDNQVPVCPLCNLPCPVRKGQVADTVVSRHIESDCMSDPAKERRKVYTNRCSKQGCKKKELIPVQCETCRLNFCLRHRHELDHECKGFQGSGRGVSNAGSAALFRFQSSSPAKKPTATTSPRHNTTASRQQQSTAAHSTSHRHSGPSSIPPSAPPRAAQPASVSALQGTLNEDEALARALQQSLAGNVEVGVPEGLTQQEREDFLLAQALSASEAEAARHPRHPAAQTVRN